MKLILFWLILSENCVLIYADASNQNPTFEITETKIYIPVVTLSTQDNGKLLPQLKSSFKRTINWNKYLSKPELLPQNLNLNHLVEPSSQGVNRLFVLAFEDDIQRINNKRHYFSHVRRKNFHAMIDGKNYFHQTMKNNKIAY